MTLLDDDKQKTCCAAIGALLTLMTAACAGDTGASQPAPSAVQVPADRLPPGSEKAVAAARAAYPGAVVEKVETPADSLGLGGPDDSIWTVHARVGGSETKLKVSGQGVVIRSRMDITPADLPGAVREGAAAAAPGAVVKAARVETRAVVRYVAMAKPQVAYRARVASKDGDQIVTVSPAGVVVGTRAAGRPEKEAAPAGTGRTKDGPIPEEAAKAVAAMRQVFPAMVFDMVEEVPYIDDATQTLWMLWYEVEFYLDGVKHEFNATPDGLVIAYDQPVSAADLPRAALDALATAVPGGRPENIVKSETRGEPRFVPIDRPVVVYVIRSTAPEGAKAIEIRLMPDGTKAEELDLPDWARPPRRDE